MSTRRCPELLKEWQEQHPDAGETHWTGHWMTTVQGEMSVCNFERSPAGLQVTLFEEDDGTVLVFPVTRNSVMATGRAISFSRDSEEVVIFLQWATQTADMGDVLAELDAEGYRPLQYSLEKRQGDSEDTRFTETEKNTGKARDVIREAYVGARSDGSLRDFSALLVRERTYQEVASGRDVSSAPGVVLRGSYRTVEALYVPDCSSIAQ